METVTLDRFELVGPLGSGADYDVRAAVDRETGEPVALKRPSPQTVSRQMHGPVEERTVRGLEAYERAGQYSAVVPRVIGVTEVALHDAYFGEDLGQPYSVRVEERASGIPLVGDPRSRILRVPIGLGQNLFALHSLARPDGVADWPVQSQLLEAQEIYANAGYALLDLGPHNVFYSPGAGRISLVDATALVGHGVERAQGNRGSQDVHDFYIEMVKFYLAPDLPPTNAVGYFDPYNQRPVISIEDECDSLISAFASADEALREVATACVGKIRQRGYASVADFASDLRECLRLITIRNEQMPERQAALEAWHTALHRLSEDHWTRYRFDANTELAAMAG
jgi:hypothetical protein